MKPPFWGFPSAWTPNDAFCKNPDAASHGHGTSVCRQGRPSRVGQASNRVRPTLRARVAPPTGLRLPGLVAPRGGVARTSDRLPQTGETEQSHPGFERRGSDSLSRNGAPRGPSERSRLPGPIAQPCSTVRTGNQLLQAGGTRQSCPVCVSRPSHTPTLRSAP